MRPKGPSKGDAKNWDAIYKELEAYHKDHGHSNVPSTLNNKLARWVASQRRDRQNKEVRMTAERISRLDKLDFRWFKRRNVTPNKSQRMGDERWREMYEKLKAYNENYGHCKVPTEANAKDPDQSVLGSWVTTQRQIRDRMPQSRKDLLDELGFLWVADNWDTMYEQLVKFKQEHGHTDVPGNKSSLDQWCRKQRAKMRQNKLPLERRDRMEEIGFNIELKCEKDERTWNAKLQRLKEYKRKHGDCLVPSGNASNRVEDLELSYWVGNQRVNYKRGTIPNHRIQKLKEVGFVWSIVERGPQILSEKQELAWEKSFEKLREFYEVHGHFVVPHMLENGKTNPLTSWVFTQRKFYAQDQIKEDRRLKLEAIDFIWNQATEHRSQRKWNAAFQDLTKFREEKGHTFVRRGDDMALWRWTKKMTWKHKRNTLSLEKEERLKSIGFWDPPSAESQDRDENNEKSEEEDEEFPSSEDDDDRKPMAKPRRTMSIPKEEDEECWSSEDDDGDRKPTAKQRRTNEKDDDRKPMAKRHRITSTQREEDEEYMSSEADNDRTPKAKRRRATDRTPTAKRRRATSTEEAPISTSLFTGYSAGTKVKKFFEGYGWFLGEITSIDEEYCCYVRYVDGDEENYLVDELEDLNKIVANVARTNPCE
jgi:hypothetical protein